MVRKSKYAYRDSLPAGFVPDPPHYLRCETYLAKITESHGKDALALQCRQEESTELRSTLSALIVDAWINQEASRYDLAVDSSETEQETSRQGVKTEILDALGIRPSDQRYLVRTSTLLQAIFMTLPAYRRMKQSGHETPKMAQEIDQEDSGYYSRLIQKWPDRTECRPGFVVANCSSYVTGALP